MNDIYETYPMNLVQVVFANDDSKKYICVDGVYEAIASLTPREQAVLESRFKDRLTLEKTGKAQNLTRERIRQVEAKALRKLRHPSRANIMISVPLPEVRKIESEYQALQKEYEWLKQVIGRIAENISPEIVERAKMELDVPLSEADLSVRSYNCLSRIGKKTLRDVAEMSDDELKAVKQLGKKSYNEIVEKLKEYGVIK